MTYTKPTSPHLLHVYFECCISQNRSLDGLDQLSLIDRLKSPQCENSNAIRTHTDGNAHGLAGAAQLIRSASQNSRTPQRLFLNHDRQAALDGRSLAATKLCNTDSKLADLKARIDFRQTTERKQQAQLWDTPVGRCALGARAKQNESMTEMGAGATAKTPKSERISPNS